LFLLHVVSASLTKDRLKTN